MNRQPAARGGGLAGRRPRRSKDSAAALTLVELLIAIAIISILAGMLLGVAARATETARVARTKQIVARIHTLVMEKYESFRSRRVEVPATTPAGAAQVLAAQRLHVLRIVMQMEMPDRWSDILNAQVTAVKPADLRGTSPAVMIDRDRPYRLPNPGQTSIDNSSPRIPRTPLCNTYVRQYAALTVNPSTPDGERSLLRNQGAECLYLLVMFGTGDGEARGLFKPADFGDTDGDGALEILDGWGRPITFVRWPKGYTNVSDLMTDDSVKDHDPFDPYRVHDKAYTTGGALSANRLVPLIASAGGDEKFGLVTEAETGVFSYGFVELNFGAAQQAVIDPYPRRVASKGSVDLQMGDEWDSDELGRPTDSTKRKDHVDNVTNHEITAR
ncbi:MAG: prepilin-type N-terminal cleavage/methylation domain-containing protein [Lacipirellulaceae bacterium]